MIDDTTIKALVKLLKEAVDSNVNSISTNIYINEKRNQISADITFELEAVDDNHV